MLHASRPHCRHDECPRCRLACVREDDTISDATPYINADSLAYSANIVAYNRANSQYKRSVDC